MQQYTIREGICMRIERVSLVAVILGLVVLNACGTHPANGGGGSIGGGSSAPVTLTMNAPFTLGTVNNQPTGVTVISFRITLTGAVLEPGNVSLLSSPQTIELTQLQTDNYVIGTATAGTGNYTGLNLTFSNPDMTIFNGPGSVADCVQNTICEIAPVLTTSTVSLSPSFTLTDNTPAALELNLSVDDSLQSDLSLNLTSGVSVQVPAVTTSTSYLTLNTVAGQVTTVGTNQFTMTTTAGNSLTFTTNSNTLYAFPTTVCTSDDFSCLATGQVVSVDANLFAGPAIQAANVTFEDNSGDPVLLGTVVSLNTAANPPSFGLVIHGQVPSTNGIDTDNFATVSLQNSTSYLIDPDVLAIPSGFTFASTADLVIGQEVLVRGNTIDVTPVTNQPSTIAVSTNELILRQSQWTGEVGIANVGTDEFTITDLPTLFTSLTPNPVTNLFAITSAQTAFVNFPSGVVGSGTWLTAKGLIFSNTTNSVNAPSDVLSIVQGAPNLQIATTPRQRSLH
jgi:hypothetical protein